MIVIDCIKVRNNLINKLKLNINALSTPPTLAVLIIGECIDGISYLNSIKETTKSLSIGLKVFQLEKNIPEKKLIEIIKSLNIDNNVNGILIQLPLPEHISESNISLTISRKKDIDCIHPQNLGMLMVGNGIFQPCTPSAIMEILDFYNITIKGKHCVILGRSNIVGKPLVSMLLNRHGTTTICHSKTKNLENITKKADILISSVGIPKIITHSMVKKNAVVIDVGINLDLNNKLCGDVDFENVKKITSYITPVPKGVGVMTVTMLIVNLLIAQNIKEF